MYVLCWGRLILCGFVLLDRGYAAFYQLQYIRGDWQFPTVTGESDLSFHVGQLVTSLITMAVAGIAIEAERHRSKVKKAP